MLKIDADLKAVSMISDTRIYANKNNRVQTFDLHIIEVSSAKYLATKAVLNSSLQNDLQKNIGVRGSIDMTKL